MKAICLTMGDPAGVGPELIIRLLDRLRPGRLPNLILIGDEKILRRATFRWGGQQAKNWMKNAQFLEPKKNPSLQQLNILSLSRLSPDQLSEDRGGKKHGRASWDYIEAGVKLCRSGVCAGMVTLPVNKAAMLKAGCPYPGHTDLLAYLDGNQAVMMMVRGRLIVALLTHHIPLRKVAGQIAGKKILTILKIMDQALRKDFRIRDPKIGVLGLNPHAGEDGALGDEEIKIIGPAVKQARQRGIAAFGPIAGDTAFSRARKGEFDALLAAYHDQGLAPLKALGFERVVNVTLGLSFVRTSPGHGTAYDLAGQGKADARSLREAFVLARRLIQNRNRSHGGR